MLKKRICLKQVKKNKQLVFQVSLLEHSDCWRSVEHVLNWFAQLSTQHFWKHLHWRPLMVTWPLMSLLLLQVNSVRWTNAVMVAPVWWGRGAASSASVWTASTGRPVMRRRVVRCGDSNEGRVPGLTDGDQLCSWTGPCSRDPCQNDGVCQVTSSTRRGDVFSEYICKCAPGFEGVHCQNSKFCWAPE